MASVNVFIEPCRRNSIRLPSAGNCTIASINYKWILINGCNITIRIDRTVDDIVYGKKPMQTFIESLPLAKQKLLNDLHPAANISLPYKTKNP